MAKAPAQFTCTACGAAHSKWAGRCESCGAWNTVVEEAALASGPRALGPKGRAIPLTTLASTEPPPARVRSGLDELDRVLGGGLVAASAILVGGDPGIGKSTLLLQAAASFARGGVSCLYVSGEEAPAQVRMRALRLGLADAPVQLATETNLRDILTTLDARRPGLVIIDSIQTMWLDTIDAAPGSVAQVRASAQELVTFAKRRGVAVVLVGHVTKDGQIAGPRVVEHMVDCVLYFEGERGHQFRILRAVKNRFGASGEIGVVEHMVDCVLYFEGERGHQFRILRAVKNRFGASGEIGVFEMTGDGLVQVANPSALFLSDRDQPAPGAAVFAGIEGSRPLLTEIQALVAPTAFGTARRTVVGLDAGRVATILAVLEARCAIPFSGLDVFLNVAGGMRVVEPAADLAIAAALLSAREDVAIPPDMVLFGEISLSGALRPVGQAENRLKEAAKLGFKQAIAPTGSKLGLVAGMKVRQMPDLTAFVGEIFGAG